MTAPDEAEVERIRAVSERGYDYPHRAYRDVRTLLAALDAARAEAQQERERAEAAERSLVTLAQSDAARAEYHEGRREAIEEAIGVAERCAARRAYNNGGSVEDVLAALRALLTTPARDEGAERTVTVAAECERCGAPMTITGRNPDPRGAVCSRHLGEGTAADPE